MASKNVQKASAMQNNSITSSSVSIAIVICDMSANSTSVDIQLDPETKGEFLLSITDGENELSGEFFID
ncbi:hypothetical protein D7V78_02580 [Parabacteroides distasonis]|uniref:Uncharacterized protein n=1 Tax=Parabacteroides distasonis TaxID=823 RepID=A0A3L7ZTB2_PARDI|nr:hypothetical protein D7V78_02580 [Parabacteroides distasonis]